MAKAYYDEGEYTGQTANVPERPDQGVARAMKEADEQVDTLDSTVNGLMNLLQPIMRPTEPTPDVEKMARSERVQCDLAIHIGGMTRRLRDVHALVRQITDRIDL